MPVLTPKELTAELRQGLEAFNQAKIDAYVAMQRRVETVEREMTIMKEARRKQVEDLTTLATILELPFPDPRKIIDAVRALVTKREAT